MPPQTSPNEAWQAEKDLLADGRELLEQLCDTTRYRHLFPEGPNTALLLEAYQELERERIVRRQTKLRPRRDRRRLRRLLRRKVRRDALARDRRLHWHYPMPRSRRLRTDLPPVVQRALESVDHDVRDDIERLLQGDERDAFTADQSSSAQSRIGASLDRGLAQFRDALINGALADPRAIPSLHPQHISFTASAQPSKRRHPIATLVLVKLPLQLMMIIWILFTSGYLAALNFFNDEVLGEFLTAVLDPILDGQLEFESVEWNAWLIWDLITGNPHTLQAHGVRVYEPYKSLGQEKDQVTAYAEHVELKLTLHEIIPWNRLGVPMVFEIPWVLHFSDVENKGELWVTTREYQPEGSDRVLISLVDAFLEPVATPPKYGYRKLSVRLDDARLDGATVKLDFREFSEWGTELYFEELSADLDFEGWIPDDGEPETRPLRWNVRGKGASGQIWMLGETLEARDLKLSDVGGGMRITPLGDMRIAGEGEVGGSPVTFDGFLRRIFEEDRSVAFQVATTDLDPIAQIFITDEDEPPAPGERPMLDGSGKPGTFSIEGPLDDPSMRAVAQGITLDLFPDPAWAMDDVDVSLVLARDPVPEMWQNDRKPDEDGDDERWIVYLETLRGAALDGSMRLHGRGQLDHIVMADDEDDPLLVSVYLDLDGINPGQLAPDNQGVADALMGSASGGAELHKLVLANGGGGDLERMHFFLHRARLTRDKGPNDDGFPRTIRADGDVLYDRVDGIDWRGLKLSTDGGYVSTSGGLNADWDVFRSTALAVRIDDGGSFLRAFGFDRYFDRLTADLNLGGPIYAPSGRDGSLSVSGVGSGGMQLTGISDARLWMESGTLYLRSPNAKLFGGNGPLELDVVLSERGRLLDDPKVRAFLDLKGVDQKGVLGSPIDAEGAELRLYVDDGNQNPVPLSEIQARGAAYAETLRIAGEQYRNANASFAFTREGIRIDQLTVAYHRPVSPLRNPGVTVEVGTLSAKGTVGFESDPVLNLDLRANGLPLTALTSFVDDELPIRGQLAKSSRIALHGTLQRPEIDGHIELDSLSTGGIPLGRGRIDFETNDVEPSPSSDIPAHRALSIRGKLGDRRAKTTGLSWSVDGVVAFGEPRRKGPRAVEADIGVGFERLPVRNLLAQPERWDWREHVDGELNDLGIRVEYCSEGSSMLASCRARAGSERDTHVTVRMAEMWIAPHEKGNRSREQRCKSEAALCSTAPFVADLDGDLLRLEQPFALRSGGTKPAQLELDGTLDLSDPPPAPEDRSCDPDQAIPESGRGRAEIQGELDLAALTAILAPYDIQAPDGRVDVQMELAGHATSPRINGGVTLPAQARKIELSIGEEESEGRRRSSKSIPIEVTGLDVEVKDSRIYLAGEAKVFDESLNFGTRGGPRSQLAVSGSCQGDYRVAAHGSIDGALVRALMGDIVRSSSGAAELDRLHLTGNINDYDETEGVASLLETVSGELTFGKRAFRLRIPYDAVTVQKGSVEFRRCSATNPCVEAPEGAYALFLGGEQGARAASRPGAALALAVGDRGRANAWGHVHLNADLDEILDATVRTSMNQVPYVQTSNSGAPELVGALTSRELVFERDDLGGMWLRGEVLVERSRWLRDAEQGVAILSFADPVPAPPEPWPEFIRNLAFDLGIKTAAPFRVDNNVIKKLEAEGELRLRGTIENPELTGSITIDRGELDLDILGELYEIEEGKVRLDRELSSSFVDILAIGKEPKKIDEQLHYITLRLHGPLDGIQWDCSALGDTSNELGVTRRCVDYLIFDAGNVDVTEQDVRRLGGTGLLYAGRPLTLVGKLTELELNQYLEDEIPRLEQYLPHAAVRLGQLGVETEIETRPEWLDWGWGDLEFGFNYLRGYPGSLVRDTRAFNGRLQILDHTGIEYTVGRRNYTNRVLILDPADYSRLELLQNWQIPSAR